MPYQIKNDQELAEAVKQAGELLQAIGNRVGRAPRPDAKVRFPRGFIHPANHQRDRLKFVADKTLRSNLAYTLMMSDIVYWLLVRTDLQNTAHEMLIKLFVSIGGNMVESITKEYLKGICGKGKGYADRTLRLVSEGVIDDSLRIELDWIWETRGKMHLFLLEESEYMNRYNTATYNRFAKAFDDLLRALSARGRLPVRPQ